MKKFEFKKEAFIVEGVKACLLDGKDMDPFIYLFSRSKFSQEKKNN